MINLIKPFAVLANTTAAAVADPSASGAQPAGGGWGSLLLPLIMIVPLGLMFFFQSRSNKKREKAERDKRNNLRVGDEVITNAGITGTVLAVKDETFTMETGPARTKLTLQKWAISTVETVHDDDGVDSLDDDLYGDDED